MLMQVDTPLLSLLGHELRAPVGVVGGYLALLEQGRERLTPEQQKAVAGARRAQLALVEVLDDLGRLTVALRAEAQPLTVVPLPQLADDVRRLAAARQLPLTIAVTTDVAVPRRGRDAALAAGLTAVAEAVGREHGAAVVVTTAIEPPSLVWRVRPAGADAAATPTRHPFDLGRSGLGVRLIAAAATIAASHATLEDLRVDGGRFGVDVIFDLEAAQAGVPPAAGPT